ncbi:uncharacterized protein LOC129639380 isoform X5 [Bubalus kerabau]|uniref:uncharacterized protein LOC129639380 isoform X5 n=1 Tax=Bubalus carabanensis TaxID=3119969 RepID=UPI00244E8D06|nr:uncharacterized protein LOC129639380 isoform X5 [Bubalus carabanensis]
MTSLLERLTTNAINWDIGRHSALGTQEPQGQAPSLPSRWFKRTEAARSSSPPVTDNHHGAGPRVQLDVAETFDHWTEPREGLSEDSLTNPEEIRYTDGSSFVLDGKRRAGSTSYNMQCQFNKDIKLQLTMENITHPWTPL